MSDKFINAFVRAPAGLVSRMNIARLRLLGAQIGSNCRVVSPDIPKNPWDILLEDGVALDRGVTLLAVGERCGEPRIQIGASSYVNRHTMFDASISIEVGANSMIGPFCYITDHDHGTEVGKLVSQQGLVEAPVLIGENVWVGAGAVILKGVTIGRDAVIGAGAVVTKDVPQASRVIGVPGRASQIGKPL